MFSIILLPPDLSILVVAALTSVAWASSCTDICFGTCDMMADTTRVFLPFFETLAQRGQDGCRALCAVTCDCVDTCQMTCGDLLVACREATGQNFLLFLQCQVQFTSCGTVCATQCTMSATAGVLDRVLRTVLPPPEVLEPTK